MLRDIESDTERNLCTVHGGNQNNLTDDMNGDSTGQVHGDGGAYAHY